jgi:hypothetical protein
MILSHAAYVMIPSYLLGHIFGYVTTLFQVHMLFSIMRWEEGFWKKCKKAVLTHVKILYCNMPVRIKRNHEHFYQRNNSLSEQSPSYKSVMWNDKLQTNISNSSAALFYIGCVIMISLSSLVKHCYGTMEKVNLHMLVTSFDLIRLLAQSIVLSLNLLMMDVLLSVL